MVTIGVVGFAVASAFCGAHADRETPPRRESFFFRVLQGAFAALMFPAAVGIVVASFPIRERGKAMAIFFAITGGLTAIGPLAGGYLTEWTWRAIFWINIPVAIVALILIWKSKPDDTRRPTTLDYRGTVLISGGMGLLVLGLQQSSVWGWDAVGYLGMRHRRASLLAVVFVFWELRAESPLLDLRIFRDRGFAVENVVLATMSVVFVPFFSSGSVYAQASLGESAANAGFYIMYFFLGFVITAQIGGRILDQRGARPSVVAGSRDRGDRLLSARRQAPRDLSLERPNGSTIMITGAGSRAPARPGEPRRGQSRAEHALQRGHRHHADRAQLRSQRRPGRARRAPDQLRTPSNVTDALTQRGACRRPRRSGPPPPFGSAGGGERRAARHVAEAGSATFKLAFAELHLRPSSTSWPASWRRCS